MSYFQTVHPPSNEYGGRAVVEYHWGRIALAVVAALVLFVALSFGGCAVTKSYDRYQKRADAHNQVAVTHILIQKAQQQAQINLAQVAAARAEAQKRVAEAVGIREAQDKIQATLTPLYVQHEFVQALEDIAHSGQNNSTVFIPTGQGGLPTVVPQLNAVHPGR